MNLPICRRVGRSGPRPLLCAFSSDVRTRARPIVVGECVRTRVCGDWRVSVYGVPAITADRVMDGDDSDAATATATTVRQRRHDDWTRRRRRRRWWRRCSTAKRYRIKIQSVSHPIGHWPWLRFLWRPPPRSSDGVADDGSLRSSRAPVPGGSGTVKLPPGNPRCSARARANSETLNLATEAAAATCSPTTSYSYATAPPPRMVGRSFESKEYYKYDKPP